MTITLRLNRRAALIAGGLIVIALLTLQSAASPVTAAQTPCPPPPEPRITQAAVQLFEHGWVLWMADTRQLYVLSMSATNKMEGTSAVYAENWEQGMAETDASIVPPGGQRQPTRGIGKLWRENPAVRGGLGWALKDAEGLMMVVTQSGDTLWANGDHDAFKIVGGRWQEFYGWPRSGF